MGYSKEAYDTTVPNMDMVDEIQGNPDFEILYNPAEGNQDETTTA